MEAQRVRIVLTGELMDGYEASEAIRALATLFGHPPEKLRNVFSGKAIPLKQELELKRAQQIQARLLSVGAKCVLQPVIEARPLPTLSLVEDVPPPGAETKIAMQVSCPKCGHPQGQADACGKCGIIFSKWKTAGAPEEGEPRASAGYGLNEEQMLHLFVDHNAEKYVGKFQHFRAARGFAATWHWPAFFVPFYWALYRKMWGWSAVIFATTMLPYFVFGVWGFAAFRVPFFVWLPLWLVWPLLANFLYYRHAQSRLARLGDRPNEMEVARAGGTSSVAVLAALGLSVLMSFAGTGMLLKKGFDIQKAQAQAVEAEMPVPDTNEGRKTMMVLRATAMLTSIWAAGGKNVADVSLETLSYDLQQPVEQFNDGWGTPVRIAPTANSFVVTSAGPDAVFGSQDDIRFEPSSTSLLQ